MKFVIHKTSESIFHTEKTTNKSIVFIKFWISNITKNEHLNKIKFVKNNYKKFSQIIKKKSHKIETETTIQMNQIDVSIETILNAFVSLFFDPNNRFKNQIFIKSTTVSKTDSEHTTKPNTE